MDTRERMTVLLSVLVALLLLPATASALPATVHVQYGENPEEQLTVFGQETPGHKNVTLTHEGGWHAQLNEVELEGPALRLQKEGFVVYSLNWEQDSYIQPAFPMEPEQIRDGVMWVKAHAAEFGGSTTIEMVGGSAGGHLAAITAEQVNRELPGTVSAVVSLSGPMDLVALREEAMAGELWAGLAMSTRRALGCTTRYSCSMALAEEFSPVDNVDAATCPDFWLSGGEFDIVPLSQQYEMAWALKQARCPVTLRTVPKGHAFAYWAKVAPEVIYFLKTH